MDEEKKEGVVSEEVKEETKTEVIAEQPIEPKVEAEVKTEVKKDEPKVENITSKKGGNGNKAAIIIIIAAVFLIIAAAGVFYYMNTMMVKADKVFKTVIDTCKETYMQTDDLEGAKTVSASVSADVDLDLTDGLIDEEILDLVNDITLKVDTVVDVEKNNMSYNITANKKDDELVNVDAYMTDDKMYVKLNDLLDKYLYVDLEDVDMEDFTIDYDAITDNEKIVVNKIFTSLSNSLKEEYFTQEKLEKIKKNTLILNDANLKAIAKDLLTSFKDDSEFITALAKLSGVKESDIKQTIEDALSEIGDEEIFEEGQSIQISIFTKGMKNEMTRMTIEAVEDEDVVLSVAIDVVDETKLNYTISVEEQTITGSFYAKENTPEDVTMSFSIKYAEYIDAKIDMTYTYSVNKSSNLELPDFSKAVEFEKISTSDAQELLKNAKNNEALMDIVEIINEYTKDEEDYDYDEDDYTVIIDDEEDDDDETSAKKVDYVDNILDNGEVKVEFKLPNSKYEIDEEWSEEDVRYFEKDDIEAYIRIGYTTEDEYFDDVEEWEYEYKIKDRDDDFYKNVVMSEIKEIKSGKNTMKYVTLTFDAGTTLEYEEIFAIYEIDDDYSYIIEIEACNTEVPQDLFEDLANFVIK